MPFTILFLSAVGSIFSSFIISGEELPSSTIKYNSDVSKQRNTPAAFIHHQSSSKVARCKNVLILSSTSNSDPQCSEKIKNILKPSISKHYSCPPNSVETLRKRFGTRKNFLGDWSNSETRQFYRSQLPRSLQSKIFSVAFVFFYFFNIVYDYNYNL
jgi:hypothetical protein